MNIAEQIETLKEAIKIKQAQIEALHRLAERFQGSDLKVSTCDKFLDFDNPSREQVKEIMLTIAAGKWQKEPHYDGRSINYITEFNGVQVRLYGAPPPANCKIVEVEVEIPAQPARTEKRSKIVCFNQEEAQAAITATQEAI